MSDFLNATVNNQFFYILPICNLICDNLGVALDNRFVDSEPRGARSSTNSFQVFDQYNDNFGFNDSGIFTIPDYIKNLNPDYISFSVTTDGSVVTNLAHQSYSISLNIIYDLLNLNPFIDGKGTQYNFSIENEYRVNCKFTNGKLYPIDLKNVKSFRDIEITNTPSIPAPTSSADKNNKARPYNITLWKKFITSSSLNKDSFVKQNSLPSSFNYYFT